jgi:plastocyanin
MYSTSILAAAGALVIGGAACASSEPVGNVAAGPARDKALEVVADNTSFSPGALDLPRGKKVTVEIHNEDDTAHDFAIESLDLNTGTIEPGKVATATFVVPRGPTEFICTYHSGMTGTIEPSA